jgi:hypothetical protein
MSPSPQQFAAHSFGVWRSGVSDAIDRQTAVDDQLGAGNVFRLVGCEEQSRVSDIPLIARPPHNGRRKSSSPASPKGDWTDDAFRLGKALLRGYKRRLSE